MTTHLGEKYPELEKRLKKHLGEYYDEYLRVELQPRDRDKRGDYSRENPWLFSAFFCALIERVDPKLAADYKLFFQDEIFPITEGKSACTWSREPYGRNTYPVGHPEYNKKRNWNTISKDELVGQVYFSNKYQGDDIAWRSKKYGIFDDYGNDDTRYKHPPSSRYFYQKACDPEEKDHPPTLIMRLHWHLDAAFDWLRIKLGFRNKSIADTIIKNYVRARAGVGREPEKELLIWATDFYFPDNHPFKEIVRRI